MEKQDILNCAAEWLQYQFENCPKGGDIEEAIKFLGNLVGIEIAKFNDSKED